MGGSWPLRYFGTDLNNVNLPRVPADLDIILINVNLPRVPVDMDAILILKNVNLVNLTAGLDTQKR